MCGIAARRSKTVLLTQSLGELAHGGDGVVGAHPQPVVDGALHCAARRVAARCPAGWQGVGGVRAFIFMALCVCVCARAYMSRRTLNVKISYVIIPRLHVGALFGLALKQSRAVRIIGTSSSGRLEGHPCGPRDAASWRCQAWVSWQSNPAPPPNTQTHPPTHAAAAKSSSHAVI